MNLRTTRRIVAGAIVAAALPIAAATSAQAATSSGCTVTPLTPIYSYTQSNGVKVLDYRINVTCSGGRTVHIQQQRWEEDDWPNGDDYMGLTSFSRTFYSSGSTTLHNYRTLPDTEIGMEEMYQQTRFYVSSNGVNSAWTGWQNSGVQAFFN